MIDLTPLEVRKKSGDFRRVMRGYEPQAVDDFLDLVADRLEELVRENAALQQRLGSTETQVSDYRERERALTEALVTAQEMREEMRRQMEREVELKRREAEAEAEAIRSTAAQIAEREEENIRRLRARQSQFLQSYRSFLERELAELSVMAETLDLGKSETPQPARKRTRRPETPAPAARPATAAAEPAPMPLPVAVPEPEPEMLEPLAPEDLFEPAPPFEREPVEPEPDHSLIDLTQHLPAPPSDAPAAPAPAQMPLDLSDEPFGEEDMPELELVDEIVEDDDDDDDDAADGWVSTLLEGKGD